LYHLNSHHSHPAARYLDFNYLPEYLIREGTLVLKTDTADFNRVYSALVVLWSRQISKHFNDPFVSYSLDLDQALALL